MFYFFYDNSNFRAHALRRAAFMYEKQIENCDEVTLNKHIKNMKEDIEVIKRQVLNYFNVRFAV